MIYLDYDTFNECRDAAKQGVSLTAIASYVGGNPDDLAQLLGLENPRKAATVKSLQPFHLWSCDSIDWTL